MTIDVTVLSVFHNRHDAVAASLTSLINQVYPSFRAIVVDDGSSDSTFAQMQKFDSEIVEVRRQNNIGFTQTMINLCADVQTEFIALHGAGDESLPHRLSSQVALLRSHPASVAIGCGIENVDEISGRRWNVLPPEPIKRGPISGSFDISHGEVVFRRDAYLRAGGYRAFFPVGQASDLFRRMSRLGDFSYVNEILYRRYLRSDGVNSRIDSILQRDILASLSAAVHHRAIAETVVSSEQSLQDDLDRFGILLPYFAPPDRGIAVALAKAATKLWSIGDRPRAMQLARKSLLEEWTAQGALTYAAIFAGIGPLASPLMQLVARLSRGHNEQSLARLKSTQKSNSMP